MTVNEFFEKIKMYGNSLIKSYELDSYIETCGEFRSDAGPTFCLKFKGELPKEYNFVSKPKKSIRIQAEILYDSKLNEVRTEHKEHQLKKYINCDEQDFLKKTKKELKAFLHNKLSEKVFWAQLILLKN